MQCGQNKVVIAVSSDCLDESVSEENADTMVSVDTIVSAGTTGKGKGLRYVKFQMESVDETIHIYYRVNLRHIGWTAFCRRRTVREPICPEGLFYRRNSALLVGFLGGIGKGSGAK